MVLEYENGDRCKGDGTRWRSTLILSCDRQVPVVSVPTVLNRILYVREGSFPMCRLICVHYACIHLHACICRYMHACMYVHMHACIMYTHTFAHICMPVQQNGMYELGNLHT